MNSAGPNSQGPGGPAPDPRLQPSPDYGTLGPGADVGKALQTGSSTPFPVTTRGKTGQPYAIYVHLIAVSIGILVAILTSSAGRSGSLWGKVAGLFSPRGDADHSPVVTMADLDRQKPQKQAEILLERAVTHSDGATDQIAAHVDHWRGRLKWDQQLRGLMAAALNSNDYSVRTSGIEVELAAYGLAKTESNVDSLERQADSTSHAQKIWALWALGLLANRGIESDRVVHILSSHLKDADEDSRRWTVEGIALVGTTSTIAPLLSVMHDDPSPLVRERAACSLAESGMLSPELRLSAVPRLIAYSEDPSLDAQTHNWAFQALGDITHQRLPNDTAAWRNWYQDSGNGGQ